VVGVLSIRVVRDSLLLCTYFPRIGDVILHVRSAHPCMDYFLFVFLLCGGPGFVTVNAAYTVYLYCAQRIFWTSVISN